MGSSLTMIDRHYGHLARDGHEHAAALLDSLAASDTATAAWTFGGRRHGQPQSGQERGAERLPVATGCARWAP
jgi:hypothetical protein